MFACCIWMENNVKIVSLLENKKHWLSVVIFQIKFYKNRKNNTKSKNQTGLKLIIWFPVLKRKEHKKD